MSVMQSQRLGPLQFYRSSAAPCPYLPGRIERKLFARLAGPDAAPVNSTLSHAGFRRSHDIIYKPACPGCMACVPVRVPVADFEPAGSLARIAKRGNAFVMTSRKAEPTREQYELFLAYETMRHADSDMARMNYDDYCAMVLEGDVDTVGFELRDSSYKLIGLMLADRLADGWSAVYSFYSPLPEHERYSLGTLLILELIALARREKQGYVYLGYWVDNSRKMGYKARFQPLERLGTDGWQPFTPPERR